MTTPGTKDCTELSRCSVPTEVHELTSLRECLRYSACDKAVCRQVQAVGSLQCCSFMTLFFRVRTWTGGRSRVGYTRWRHSNSCSAPLRFWLVVQNAPTFIYLHLATAQQEIFELLTATLYPRFRPRERDGKAFTQCALREPLHFHQDDCFAIVLR